MSELISGKEAKLAWANGDEVEFKPKPSVYTWASVCNKDTLGIFEDDELIFRLKPRTIKINGIEVPAPFEPKDSEEYYYLKTGNACGFASGEWGDDSMQKHYVQFGAWRTEEEIKQVVAALRQVFKGNQ